VLRRHGHFKNIPQWGQKSFQLKADLVFLAGV
jgi:hypothetical protein